MGTRIRLPGRTEIVHESPLVVLDGAHNPAAFLALREAMTELPHAAGPRVLVCGALRGRDLASALARLAKEVDSVILCEPPSPQAMSTAYLAAALGSTPAPTLIADPADALRAALTTAGTHGMMGVTGSPHLLHRARRGLPPQPGSR
ncbi:glutamate ligase domain-containing protein [Pseudonocardia sp. CA-142604]|uniref:glutamate ligase domain-containing protein n=1 Tax=Pseudonocardia sp. CA-142604 TaxID=3240024 RepID=UPI003D923F45